jgi:CHASE2 domain-containing sensor protein
MSVLGALPGLPSQDVATDPKRYLILLAVGFVIALLGHMTRTKTLIAAGIALIFLATFILPLYFHFSSM